MKAVRAVLAAALLLPVAPTLAAGYTFTLIAGQSGPFSGFEGSPSLNRQGNVAFVAGLDAGGSGVFRSNDDGAFVAIAANSIAVGSYRTPFLNDNNVVALNVGGSTLQIGDGGPAATVVFPTYGVSVSAPALNNNGAIAYAVNGTQRGVFARNNDQLVRIVPNAQGFGVFPWGAPSVNNNGTVAFSATLDVGIPQLRSVFTGAGGPVTTVADFNGPFSDFRFSPAINDAGVVAFGATLDAGGSVIYLARDGGIRTVADTGGPFSQFLRGPSLNNRGQVAFHAELDAGGAGIFTGPDPTRDKVVQTGDALFGSVVTGLEFFRALNDHGQIAFRFTLTNGRQGIARANPGRLVPRPNKDLISPE